MNGFLFVNKPLGYTSRDIVNIVGKILGTRKIGHTGTLDPNASGLMILAIGNALKLCELLNNHNKEYIAEVILGIETDTLDTDTNSTILREENVDISDNKIYGAVNSFKGKYMQEVPKYSAVKVNGKKLYEYARGNIPVELPKKEVVINDISVVGDINHKNGKISFTIKANVGSGTYIRSLVRDIGKKLNVPSVLNSLVRNSVDIYSINDSYTLNDIQNDNFKLVSITGMFSNIPCIKVDNNKAFKVKNGVILDRFFDSDMAFIFDCENNLLSLYKNMDNKSRPYKMFV